MATVQFSWSDSFHAAVSSCLPCFQHPAAESDPEDAQTPRPLRNPAFAHAIPPPRARPDELEGLLADASDDADALSLHTNPGERSRARKKKQRQRRRTQPKHIRVFGFDLFGRTPPIQLPESDNDDDGEDGEDSGDGNRSLRPGGEGRTRKISSSTLDSDAAPLDASAIEELSAARHAEALAREEEERRAKEERRRKRRERKELKRAAMARALELQANGEEDFEGFQGSGPAYGATSPFSPSVGSGTGTMSDSITSSQQEFGPFAQGQPVERFDPDAAEAAREAAEAEADGADFGGESYTSRPRKTKSRSSHGTGTTSMSTSDTRSSSSRGTGSHGHTHVHPGQGAAPHNHQFLASLQAPTHTHAPGAGIGITRPPPSPLSQGADGYGDGDGNSVPPSPMSPHVTERKKRRKSQSKSANAHSHATSLSISTSSQSATASGSGSSLTSPPPSALVHPSAAAAAAQAHDDFEGFPGDFGSGEMEVRGGGAMVDLHVGAETQAEAAEAEAKRDAYVPAAARFPSAGFGRTNSKHSGAGVFLARRGDE